MREDLIVAVANAYTEAVAALENRIANTDLSDVFQQGLQLDIRKQLGTLQQRLNQITDENSLLLTCGAYQKAETEYKECLKSAKNLGDRQGEAKSLLNLGVVALALDNYMEAGGYLQESPEVIQRIGHLGVEKAESLLERLPEDDQFHLLLVLHLRSQPHMFNNASSTRPTTFFRRATILYCSEY